MTVIEKGSPRYAHSIPATEGDFDLTSYFHVRCALEYAPEGLAVALKNSKLPFPDREAITKEVSALVGRLKRTSKTKAGVEVRESVPLLQDALGRPRARILYDAAGSYTHFDSALDRNATKGRWASPRREYSFIPPRGVYDVGLDDPAVPLLGTVLVLEDKEPKLSSVRWRLCAWRQRRLPSPALCIISNSAATRERSESSARAFLEAIGFSGDEAPVLHSAVGNNTLLTALVELLDTVLPEPTTSRDERTRTRRALDTLVELVAQERIEATQLLLSALRNGFAPKPSETDRDYFDPEVYDEPEEGRTVDPFAIEPLLPAHQQALEHCLTVKKLRSEALLVQQALGLADEKTAPKMSKKRTKTTRKFS